MKERKNKRKEIKGNLTDRSLIYSITVLMAHGFYFKVFG